MSEPATDLPVAAPEPKRPGVFKRLWARTPWQRIAILEGRMAGLCACPSCGTVMVAGHPGVRRVTAPSGEVIELCKWDHSRIAQTMKAQRHPMAKA